MKRSLKCTAESLTCHRILEKEAATNRDVRTSLTGGGQWWLDFLVPSTLLHCS